MIDELRFVELVMLATQKTVGHIVGSSPSPGKHDSDWTASL